MIVLPLNLWKDLRSILPSRVRSSPVLRCYRTFLIRCQPSNFIQLVQSGGIRCPSRSRPRTLPF